MITKTRLLLRTAFGHYIVKILFGILLTTFSVVAIFYFKLTFFPDFSLFQIVQCVNANDIALRTITPNPIEMHFIGGSDAIRIASISNSSTIYEPTPEPSLLEQGGVLQENEQPRPNFYYVCPTVTLYIGAGIAVVS
jgi:hypothetical protein